MKPAIIRRILISIWRETLCQRSWVDDVGRWVRHFRASEEVRTLALPAAMRAVLAGQATEGGRWHVALYHLSAKAVSRSTGRSAVGAAAYRSGERLTNERDGVTHDYTRKRGVLSSFIVAPAGAEAWASDRSGLWNRAEAAEARKDAKVAREYELALPAELSAPEREALARQFAQAVVERFGVVADVALHAAHREGDQRNWHVHILTTTRAANENGLGAKTRVLDSPKTSAAEIEALREVWAEQVNAALERARVTARVDHRSFARQDAERGHDPRDRIRPPGVHLGPAATAIERRAARERVRGLSDDAGVMERHRAKQLRGASRRDAMREERSERHFEVAQARLEAREAASEVVQLEAERERRVAAAEAAQKAAQVAQRAAEREKAQKAAEAVWRGVLDRQYAQEPAPPPAITPERAKLNRWQAMSVDDMRVEIERVQPLGVSLRPGMAQAREAQERAKKAYNEANATLSKDQSKLDKLMQEGDDWVKAHPILDWLHDKGWLKNAEASRIEAAIEEVWQRVEEAKPGVATLKSAMDEAVKKAEDLAAQYRAEREQEMKALEPDLKVLNDLLAERQEEARQAQCTQERDRGDEMEMDL